jgi:monofunctional biosynthetic peptidoglycan transglycosylase
VRILRALGWAYVIFVLGSILWVLAYRFVNPPVTFTMIGDLMAGRGAERQWMSLDRIDRDAVRAVIAGEDSKFCQHQGFDLQAIEAAMRRNARGGSIIRGGSTISQQTAKNAFLWQGGGWFRKGLEAWFTVLIERLWDKRRIMEVYLNVAETGIGTYGVNAGAQRYFRHDASHLSPQEAARIAAVLPLPKRREAVTPTGFTRRYGGMIAARMRVVAQSGLDACVYAGTAAPRERPEPVRAPLQRRAPTPAVQQPKPQPAPPPLPGEEFEAPEGAAAPPVSREEVSPSPVGNAM